MDCLCQLNDGEDELDGENGLELDRVRSWHGHVWTGEREAASLSLLLEALSYRSRRRHHRSRNRTRPNVLTNHYCRRRRYNCQRYWSGYEETGEASRRTA